MTKTNISIYIAGNNARGRQTISLLKEACNQLLPANTYNIKVVDILKFPTVAEQKKILALPTVIRETPQPEKRVIGELKNLDKAIAVIEYLIADLPNPKSYA